MSVLWKIRAEITVQPEDFPSGDTAGFMNIVTWAHSVEIAQTKIAAYFEPFGWHIVEVEEAQAIDTNLVYDSDDIELAYRPATTSSNK